MRRVGALASVSMGYQVGVTALQMAAAAAAGVNLIELRERDLDARRFPHLAEIHKIEVVPDTVKQISVHLDTLPSQSDIVIPGIRVGELEVRLEVHDASGEGF